MNIESYSSKPYYKRLEDIKKYIEASELDASLDVEDHHFCGLPFEFYITFGCLKKQEYNCEFLHLQEIKSLLFAEYCELYISKDINGGHRLTACYTLNHFVKECHSHNDSTKKTFIQNLSVHPEFNDFVVVEQKGLFATPTGFADIALKVYRFSADRFLRNATRVI